MSNSKSPAPVAQPPVKEITGGELYEIFRPLALQDLSGHSCDVRAAQGAAHLASVLHVRNQKIALAAVAAWERG